MADFNMEAVDKQKKSNSAQKPDKGWAGPGGEREICFEHSISSVNKSYTKECKRNLKCC